MTQNPLELMTYSSLYLIQRQFKKNSAPVQKAFSLYLNCVILKLQNKQDPGVNRVKIIVTQGLYFI
jgi:hypothetical protein